MSLEVTKEFNTTWHWLCILLVIRMGGKRIYSNSKLLLHNWQNFYVLKKFPPWAISRNSFLILPQRIPWISKIMLGLIQVKGHRKGNKLEGKQGFSRCCPVLHLVAYLGGPGKGLPAFLSKYAVFSEWPSVSHHRAWASGPHGLIAVNSPWGLPEDHGWLWPFPTLNSLLSMKQM